MGYSAILSKDSEDLRNLFVTENKVKSVKAVYFCEEDGNFSTKPEPDSVSHSYGDILSAWFKGLGQKNILK